jgi:putative drug exporter of the RND superfamily
LPHFIGLSTFAVNLLVSLGIAAGTDYGIFFIGRYQEARQAGEDRETAYYTTYRKVAHVVLASGLTIARATYCLGFTRMPYFQTLAVSCAVGMLVAVAVALTLVSAVLTIGSRFGLFDPKRRISVRGWRRVGTPIVRWPAPIFAATCAVALIGLLALPGYKTSYNEPSGRVMACTLEIPGTAKIPLASCSAPGSQSGYAYIYPACTDPCQRFAAPSRVANA